LRFALAPALAAAVLLIVFFVNRGPSWSIHRAYGTGTVTVDGQTIPIEETETLARRIGTGQTLRLSDTAGLELRCGDRLILEATPGTEFTVPNRLGRWKNREVRIEVRTGEILAMTGPDFTGHSLDITTAEGQTLLTGTIVSVFRDDALTCVCVLEGEARIGTDAADLEAIPAGMRKVMFRDGRPPLVSEIAPAHLEGLAEFAERNRGAFRD
jgi:hypothetical protein